MPAKKKKIQRRLAYDGIVVYGNAVERSVMQKVNFQRGHKVNTDAYNQPSFECNICTTFAAVHATHTRAAATTNTQGVCKIFHSSPCRCCSDHKA